MVVNVKNKKDRGNKMNTLTTYFKKLFTTNYFKGWSKFDLVWLFLATLFVSIGAVIGLQASPDTFVMGAVSIVGTITGTWCVIAVNKQRLSNYIFGLVNVIAFGVLYAHWGLYGMAALNIFYFIPMQFHGMYNWFKNRKSNDEVRVRYSSLKGIITYLSITLVGVVGFFFLLSILQDTMGELGFVTLGGYSTELLWLDSIGLVGNVVAQVLMNKRLTDQWIYWWVIDITQTLAFGIILFLMNDLFALSMFLMYIVWTINAFIGFYYWNKDIRLTNNE